MAGYSPVYSSQFVMYTDGSPNTTFEVPSGYTAVVRQITTAVTAGDTLCSVNIQNSALADAVPIYIKQLTGLLQTDSAEGHWVCPAEGLIDVYQQTFGVGLSIYVGGYLLRNVLP